jgi:hypothetical protein
MWNVVMEETSIHVIQDKGDLGRLQTLEKGSKHIFDMKVELPIYVIHCMTGRRVHDILECPSLHGIRLGVERPVVGVEDCPKENNLSTSNFKERGRGVLIGLHTDLGWCGPFWHGQTATKSHPVEISGS